MLNIISRLCRVGAATIGIFAASSTLAQAATFEIINNGNHDIVSAWASPSSSTSWGRDWLGSYVLDPGVYFNVSVPGCTADIRLLYDDGEVYTRTGFDICAYNFISNY